MIFTFRLVSDEVANFKREIKIDATSTFLDLKNAICECTGYDKGQLSSFFLCDRNWEKKREITFEDMGCDDEQDVVLMEESELDDMILDEGQKLLYVFDYMSDRVFFMEMTQMEPGKNLRDPICSLSVGKAPEEFMELDLFDTPDVKVDTAKTNLDMDDDYIDTEGYNDDELDAQGFGELDMDEN